MCWYLCGRDWWCVVCADVWWYLPNYVCGGVGWCVVARGCLRRCVCGGVWWRLLVFGGASWCVMCGDYFINVCSSVVACGSICGRVW